MEIKKEIRVEETGPDFVISNISSQLVKSSFCDLALVCRDNCVLLAHCSVLSAVSGYLQNLLKDQYSLGVVLAGPVSVMLPEVGVEDMTCFLELVYTGKVSMMEMRREQFTTLLELLSVIDDIGECVSYQNGVGVNGVGYIEENIGGGVTIQRVNKNKKTSDQSKTAKRSSSISVNIEPVISTPPSPALLLSSLQPLRPPSSSTMELPMNILEPTVKLEVLEPPDMDSILPTGGGVSPPSTPNSQSSSGPPPVESLLAHISNQLESGTSMETDANISLAAADQATKEWLYSAKVGIPKMIRNGDTGQIALAHADAVTGRKCERCRCPLCMDPNRSAGEPNMHLCHYPNCGKIYKKTSHLRAHLRWHIGDQPYLCSWPGCARRFTRSDELHRHFRIHTGERKHKCGLCGKCFSRSDHLKKHTLSHHGGQNNKVASTSIGDKMETDAVQLPEVGSYQGTNSLYNESNLKSVEI